MTSKINLINWSNANYFMSNYLVYQLSPFQSTNVSSMQIRSKRVSRLPHWHLRDYVISESLKSLFVRIQS